MTSADSPSRWILVGGLLKGYSTRGEEGSCRSWQLASRARPQSGPADPGRHRTRRRRRVLAGDARRLAAEDREEGAASRHRDPHEDDVPTTVIEASPLREEPIRAEIFGIERLEQHAESLAAAQRTTEKPSKGRNLLARVEDNARVLLAAYRDIAETVREKREITPAAEWLLDNFHVVDEQIRDIRDHLPKSYYRLLPKIAEGHLAGHPRVYGLAWAYVAHTDSRFELETLQRFVRAYQRVQPLTIGELWAIAIHLRVALVENLRRLAQLIVRSRQARAKADELADRLLGLSGWPVETGEGRPAAPGRRPPARRRSPMQLFQRLRDQDPSVLPVLDRLNEMLAAQGTSADEVVAREQHAQGAANVTVRNIITSMRWMSSVDWTGFLRVRQPGGRDPPRASRGSPRWTSRPGASAAPRSSCSPEARGARSSRWHRRPCAWRPTPAARVAGGQPRQRRGRRKPRPGPRRAALGSPVSGVGVPRSTRRTTCCPEDGRPSRSVSAFVLPCDSGSAVSIAPMRPAATSEPLPPSLRSCSRSLLSCTWTAGAALPVLVLLGILGLAPASEVAVALVHRLVTLLVSPRSHPKLELSRGVPPAAAQPWSSCPRFSPARPTSRSRSSGSRCTTWRTPKGSSPSPSSPTGRMPAMSTCPETTSSLPPWSTASTASTRSTRARLEGGSGSFCCIAGVSGTKGKASGSDGKGSEASSTS